MLMLRRLYSVAVPSVIFFACTVCALFQISRVDGKTGYEDVHSELGYFGRAIYRVIEAEGRRPAEDRVNDVIRSGELVDVDEGADDNLLQELVGAQVGPLNAPPIYIESNDLANGFGFYITGDDGESKSRGNDPDDVSTWDIESVSRYRSRLIWELRTRYAAMALGPGLIVFWLLFRMTRNRRVLEPLAAMVKGVTLFIGIPIVLLALLAHGVAWFIFGSPFNNESDYPPQWEPDLPKTATEIHEDGGGEKLIGEFWNRLRAKVSESEFIEFCERWEMKLHTPEREYEDSDRKISWNGYPADCGGWWVPTDSIEDTYVWQEGTEWWLAKYEKGYLYFHSFKH